MKNDTLKILTFVSVVLFAAGTLFTSCEGPEGAAGNAVCIECHNLDTDAAIQEAYDSSGHAAGHYVGYAGGRSSCAMCHSHEGAIETIRSGQTTVAGHMDGDSTDVVAFGNPTPISCETCHSFHTTLDMANEGPDYAIRINEPNVLLMDETVTLDLGDNSNLCARCHQPRRPGPVADADGNAKVTSSHYGPHHGPQSTVLKGIGAYGVADSESAHLASEVTCITCHMHKADDGVANHTWEPQIEACTGCHDGATSFDINGKQTEIAALMETLKGKLITAGLLEGDDEHGYHPVRGTFTADQVGALYNYVTVLDDRSNGVHNYPYTKAMLDKAIADMGK